MEIKEKNPARQYYKTSYNIDEFEPTIRKIIKPNSNDPIENAEFDFIVNKIIVAIAKMEGYKDKEIHVNEYYVHASRKETDEEYYIRCKKIKERKEAKEKENKQKELDRKLKEFEKLKKELGL